MTAQLLNLKKAAQKAAENKSTAISAVETARRATEEARQRKSEAEALCAEAEEIRKGLAELASVQAFLDKDGKVAVCEAKARLVELEANEGVKALVAEREVAEAEADRRALKAAADRFEREAKAKKAKAAVEKKARELSGDILGWLRATGKNRLGLVTAWAGEGLAKSAVRLERCSNGNGQTFIKVSAVRGETEIKVGQTWLATYPSLPMVLRKGVVKAGWVVAPGAKA